MEPWRQIGIPKVKQAHTECAYMRFSIIWQFAHQAAQVQCVQTRQAFDASDLYCEADFAAAVNLFGTIVR